MCGIVGYSGVATCPKLDLAVSALRHRGPDDCGTYYDRAAGLGLGHTRLSIQDLSPAGHQPMEDPSTGVVLTYNGEIYNFKELKADLEAAGVHFRGHSDTEVLLHLYLKHGIEMLPLLEGMYAFGLWDPRVQQLLMARDPLGIKPLYYAAVADGFYFASEMKALRHLHRGPYEFDNEAIDRYLTFLWCPGEGTPIKSIRKLGPGEALIVRDGVIRRHWQHYRLPIFEPEPQIRNVDEAIELTRKALRRSVHQQMVSDVPVGAFLSGGLDSSAIVAFAREVAPNIKCFTIDTRGQTDPGMVDDLPYAREVAEHLGVELEVVTIDSGEMATRLPEMIAQLDEPLADPAPLNVLYISELARQNGIKVLLSGAGGDDLFTGYRRHRALQLERYWSWLPHPLLRALAATVAHLDQRRPRYRRLAKAFRGAPLPREQRLLEYFAWQREETLRDLYEPEFRSTLSPGSAFDPMRAFIAAAPPNSTPLQRMLALEQRFFLTDHNLNYTDKMSMAAGVESRLPFLDRQIVALSARIPDSLKQRGRIAKWTLKRAMAPQLPRRVVYRPKAGFGAPLRQWITTDWNNLVLEATSTDSSLCGGILSASALEALVQATRDGRIDATYTVFSAMCLHLWHRQFNRPTCPPPQCHQA